MSRATLYVRFPDGTVKYGIYNGTSDVADHMLYDDPHEAWADNRNPHGWDFEEGEGVPVDVATDYGAGWSWKATATLDHLTSAHDALEVERERPFPSWARYPVVPAVSHEPGEQR